MKKKLLFLLFHDVLMKDYCLIDNVFENVIIRKEYVSNNEGIYISATELIRKIDCLIQTLVLLTKKYANSTTLLHIDLWPSQAVKIGNAPV